MSEARVGSSGRATWRRGGGERWRVERPRYRRRRGLDGRREIRGGTRGGGRNCSSGGCCRHSPWGGVFRLRRSSAGLLQSAEEECAGNSRTVAGLWRGVRGEGPCSSFARRDRGEIERWIGLRRSGRRRGR